MAIFMNFKIIIGSWIKIQTTRKFFFAYDYFILVREVIIVFNFSSILIWESEFCSFVYFNLPFCLAIKFDDRHNSLPLNMKPYRKNQPERSDRLDWVFIFFLKILQLLFRRY